MAVVESLMNELVERNFMLREGNRYLSLALDASDYTPSDSTLLSMLTELVSVD